MYAVEVTNGYKYFGRAGKPLVVLDNINVRIKCGTLYALLGPSACGKTTLLSCIIGLLSLKSGEVKVFGNVLTSKKTGILGSKLGYMPQEIGLIERFSIREIVYYFGFVYGMASDEIEINLAKFMKFFMLPDENQLLYNCSGGQQRSVSFMVSVLHNPKLLILDEPTVGLDPCLRQKMWDFLKATVESTKMTIIITTHYIEEARKAECVGIMREGKLLAEDCPQQIMNELQVSTLEEAFLQLCLKKSKTYSERNDHFEVITENEAIKSDAEEEEAASSKVSAFSRIKALSYKNAKALKRIPGVSYAVVIFPFIIMCCIFIGLGGDIKYINIGVISDELDDVNECQNKSLITAFSADFKCEVQKLSCDFINLIDNDEFFTRIPYTNLTDAIKNERNLGAIIHFQSNFTESFHDLLENAEKADRESFERRIINAYVSPLQVPYLINNKLFSIYQIFSDNLMSNCQYPEKIGRSPIRFEEILESKFFSGLQDLFASGLFTVLLFFLTLLCTCATIIYDRLEGVWNRSLLAGIKVQEMVISHVIVTSGISLIQFTIMTVTGILLYDISDNGNTALLLLLASLQGICGMCCGILVSTVCRTYRSAIFTTNAIQVLICFSTGVFWPIEGQPAFMKFLLNLLPFNYVIKAFRLLLFSRVTYWNPAIFFAFGLTVFYTLLFVFLSILFLKIWK